MKLFEKFKLKLAVLANLNANLNYFFLKDLGGGGPPLRAGLRADWLARAGGAVAGAVGGGRGGCQQGGHACDGVV